MGVIFDPAGYGTFAFHGATLRCESCGHEWQLSRTETGSILLDGKCPVCPASLARVVRPGPGSEPWENSGF